MSKRTSDARALELAAYRAMRRRDRRRSRNAVLTVFGLLLFAIVLFFLADTRRFEMLYCDDARRDEISRERARELIDEMHF
jgi:hypothetical protein